MKATKRLASFPRSGRIVPELDRDDVREVVGDFRVMYRLLPNEIEVQLVIHGARLVKPSDLAQRNALD